MENAMRKPRILVLAGSTRKESIHRKLARLTVESLRAAGVDATFADLRDWRMVSMDDALHQPPFTVSRLRELLM